LLTLFNPQKWVPYKHKHLALNWLFSILDLALYLAEKLVTLIYSKTPKYVNIYLAKKSILKSFFSNFFAFLSLNF